MLLIPALKKTLFPPPADPDGQMPVIGIGQVHEPDLACHVHSDWEEDFGPDERLLVGLGSDDVAQPHGTFLLGVRNLDADERLAGNTRNAHRIHRQLGGEIFLPGLDLVDCGHLFIDEQSARATDTLHVPGSGVPPQLGLPARASRVTGDGLPDFALFRPNIYVDIVLASSLLISWAVSLSSCLVMAATFCDRWSSSSLGSTHEASPARPGGLGPS